MPTDQKLLISLEIAKLAYCFLCSNRAFGIEAMETKRIMTITLCC